MINLDFIGLFILLSGFIIGLGAVTVIDIHGFLGRKSSYWTEATIRTHKITKPLIWFGIFLAIIGGFLFFRDQAFTGILVYLCLIAFILILNGLFLSFYISPILLKRENEGMQSELLPKSFQNKIVFSLLISDIGWWGGLGMLVWFLVR